MALSNSGTVLQNDFGQELVAPGMPFVELTLNVDGQPVVITMDNYIQSMRHTLQAHGVIGVAELSLFDEDFDRIEDYLIRSKWTGTIRYGWRVDPNATTQLPDGVFGPAGPLQRDDDIQTPLRSFYLLKYQPQFEPNGVRLQLTLADRPVLDIGATHSRTFPGYQTTSIDPVIVALSQAVNRRPYRISDIVELIMREDGYTKFDIAPTALFTGDPTEGGATEDGAKNECELRQFSTNWYFITNVLTPLAKAQDGDAKGYYFGVTNDTVYFKPVLPTVTLKRRYHFGRDLAGTMRSWDPQINGTMMLVRGGFNLSVQSYDPREGILLHRDIPGNASPQTGQTPPGGASGFTSVPGQPESRDTLDWLIAMNPNLIGAMNFDDLAKKVGRVSVVPWTSRTKVEEWAKDKFARARGCIVTANAEVLGDPNLFPLDLIEVYAYKRQGDLHYSSGSYIIESLVNEISNGLFTTRVTAIANSLTGPDAPAPGTPMQTRIEEV